MKLHLLLLICLSIFTFEIQAEEPFPFVGEWEGAITTSVGIQYAYFRMNPDRTGIFVWGLTGEKSKVVEKFGNLNVKAHDGYCEIILPKTKSGLGQKLLLVKSNVGVGVNITHFTHSDDKGGFTNVDPIEFSLERVRSPSLFNLLEEINDTVNK